MEDEIKEQVKEAIGQADETAPSEETKEVPSGEVKPAEKTIETKPETVENPAEIVDVKKYDERINNLNIALSQERTENKTLAEKLSKLEPLIAAFSPTKEEDKPVEQTEQEKFEEWYNQKKEAEIQDAKTKEIQENIKKQVETLANEWNGEDGKPKYDDEEVYNWQKDNNKMHLMPEEAFFLMKRDDIVNYQAKESLAKSRAGVTAERPGGSVTEHVPEKIVPKNDKELKQAVLEALSLEE